MLELAKRLCKIGTSINVRSEMHGEDGVTALDIPLSEIMLSAEEFNVLMCHKGAHNLLFDHTPNSFEPTLRMIGDLSLKGKIESVTVFLHTKHGRKKLVNCKLSKIKLDLRVGGLTAMACQVQCTPDFDEETNRIFESLNGEIEVELAAENYDAQTQLALGSVPVATSQAAAVPKKASTPKASKGKRKSKPKKAAAALGSAPVH